MAGATDVLGIRYPTFGDLIVPQVFQDFATDVAAVLAANDLLLAARNNSPACGLSFSAVVAVATGVEFTVTPWVEVYDTDAMFAAGTPDRMTVTTAGVYLVQVSQAIMSGYATLTSFRPSVWQNGVLRSGERKHATNVGITPETDLAVMLACAAGDTIQAKLLWTGTGGPVNFAAIAIRAHLICPLV